MANIPISSFTAAANATGIGMSGFSLTGANAQSMLDLAGTWNTSGTPTGLKLNVTDTASNAASLLMDLQTGGVSQFRVAKGGVVGINITGTGGPYGIAIGDSGGRLEAYGSAFGVQPLLCSYAGGFAISNNTGTLRLGSASDTILARDAANTFAQRNGTNAQTLRIYNTFTDASNYERLSLSGNVTSFRIAGEALGTGASRSIVFDTVAGAGGIVFATGGTSRWAVSSSAGAGHFIASTDNAVDIGLSGANRPRNIFAAGDIYTQSNTTGFFLGTSADVALLRDDANILAQRRSTNPQIFRIYNTSTDASNYERGVMAWISNDLKIGVENAGTGASNRQLHLYSGGILRFYTNNVHRWNVDASGNFVAATDNAFDIGASAANRPRDLWLARNADVRGSVYIGGFVEFLGISAGVVCLRQFATSDFNRLQFGGTTASFPSIQRNGNELRLRLADDSGFCPVRVSQVGFNGATSSFPMLSNNGTTLQTRLADDSGFAPHSMQYTEITDGITAPGAAAGRARIYVDTADGDLKIVFADGTVKTIVTDT